MNTDRVHPTTVFSAMLLVAGACVGGGAGEAVEQLAPQPRGTIGARRPSFSGTEPPGS